MSARVQDRTERELLSILGEDAFVRLCEHFGGTGVHVPLDVAGTRLHEVLGLDAAEKLSEAYGRDVVTVPLSRALRAHYYARAGANKTQIALKLGMTRQGVQRLFREAERRGHQKRQFELFDGQ